MIKNIVVVDEQGNVCGATYPKRARGLVKKGRARFLSDTTICLACPPNDDLEDMDMSEQNLENTTYSAAEEHPVAAAESRQQADGAEDKYTMNYCLAQIEQIRVQTEHLNRAMEQLMTEESSPDKATALADMVRCRETTNQQLLSFYQQMYEDLKLAEGGSIMHKARLQEKAIAAMQQVMIANDYESDRMTDAFNAAFDSIRHLGD